MGEVHSSEISEDVLEKFRYNMVGKISLNKGNSIMDQFNITVNKQDVHHLFMSHTKDPGLRNILESVLNQLLEAQLAEHIGAQRYERTDERQTYRNGSRLRA